MLFHLKSQNPLMTLSGDLLYSKTRMIFCSTELLQETMEIGVHWMLGNPSPPQV